jgi:coiled-coil domain-containing protein 55
MKLSFSLNVNKPKPVGEAPSLKRPAAFSSPDDEEPVDAAFTSSTDRKASPNKRLLAQNVQPSTSRLKKMEAEKKVDPTVYQYDEVWDKMQESKLRQKEAKDADSKQRKVSFNPFSTFLYRRLIQVTYSPNISPDC